MRTLLLVISIALAVGCRDQGIAHLEAIRGEICACKTPACGEAAMKRVPETKVKTNARSQKIAREMMDCLAKLYATDRPATGPDQAPQPPTGP
jgi:hypothetical protein